MHVRTKFTRPILAMVLCVSLAVMTQSSIALAQNRGTSGLPPGPGNPMATLEQQIDTLTQQIGALAGLGQNINALQQQLDALQTQMGAWSGLQGQINTLNNQMTGLNNQMTGLNNQLSALSAQVAALGGSGGGSLGVFDATEKRMGDVVGIQDNLPWVSMEAAGHLFVLQVLPGQLIGQFLWFSGENCSGNTFIAGFALSNGPNVFSIAAVDEPGGVIYAADAGSVPAKVSVRSVRQHDASCFTFSASILQNVLPAVQVMTLDTVFQRPYSVH